MFSAEVLCLQVGGWCLLEPRSLLLADQTAGAAWFKSLAAGSFLLPQQEPEGFMVFSAIRQLGSCLTISSQLGNCSKSPSLPTPPPRANTCTPRSNIQCCAPAHSQTQETTACYCNVLLWPFCTNSLESFTRTTRCSWTIKQESSDLDGG